MKNGHKYGAKAVYIAGQRFPSKGEGERYLYLKELERIGYVRGLRLQVPFELLPAIHEKKILKAGPRKGQAVDGRLLWPSVTYVADFVYGLPDGSAVVEDFKGVETPLFKLKRRLFYETRGITIKIVKRPTEPIGHVDG